MILLGPAGRDNHAFVEAALPEQEVAVCLARSGEQARIARARSGGPVVEHGGAAHVEVAEERSAVEGDGAREVPGLAGRLELHGIDREHAGRVELDEPRSRSDRSPAEYAPDVRERIAEGVPGALLVLAAPEHLDEPLARRGLT